MCNSCLKEKIWVKIDTFQNLNKSFSEWTNPFVDAKKFRAKSNEWYKILKEYFFSKADEFEQRYNELSGWVWFLWKVLNRTWIKKAIPVRELSYEEVVWITNEIFDQEEFYEIVQSFYWDELPEWFAEELHQWMLDQWITAVETAPLINAQAQENLNDYFYKWSTWYMTKVQSQLEDIVLYWFDQWKSTANIAKDITAKIKKIWTVNAEMIARTESIRVSAEISLWTYTDIWVTHYEILPATTACPICKARAAQNPYKVTDREWMPSIHPNCRCSIIPVIPWWSI